MNFVSSLIIMSEGWYEKLSAWDVIVTTADCLQYCQSKTSLPFVIKLLKIRKPA